MSWSLRSWIAGRFAARRNGRLRPAPALTCALATLAALLSFSAAGAGARPACTGLDVTTTPLPDPVSGRRYEIQVSLPRGYSDDPDRTWPLLILTDGGRAFAGLSCDVRRLADKGTIAEEPVVVGLSYAKGEDPDASRNRDYTPIARGPDARVYGGAAAYQAYLRTVVIPHVEGHYRTDPHNRLFWGHSYGGLLGLHILLTQPDLFQTYLIGSPSIWFADRAILTFENVYAQGNTGLDATVLLHVGGLETAGLDPTGKRTMITDMEDLVERLQGRGYPGLRVRTTVLPEKNHVGVIGPGFLWALTEALGPDR